MKIQIEIESDTRLLTLHKVEELLQQASQKARFSYIYCGTANEPQTEVTSDGVKMTVTTDDEAREVLCFDSETAHYFVKDGTAFFCAGCSGRFDCGFMKGDVKKAHDTCAKYRNFRIAVQQLKDSKFFCDKSCKDYQRGKCELFRRDRLDECRKYDF